MMNVSARLRAIGLFAVFVSAVAFAQPARIELYAIPTMTLTGAQFLTGDRSGKPVLIAGELRLPPAGGGKIAAVVLVHGSGGVRANVDNWANEFVAQGMGAFILDSFSGRGIVSTSEDQTQLHELAMLFDAYRALERLARHPRIDSERIAIMGFSKGAVAALYSSLRRFERGYGAVDATFAAHIGFYTPCNVSFIGDTDTGNKPIRLFHGASDDLVQVAACRDYVRRLRRADRDVQLTEYADTWHVFDSPGPALVDCKGPNRATCRMEERAGGQIVNLANGRPFTFKDPCVTQSAHLGYNADAHAQSVKAVKAFLAETLKLN